MTDTDISPAQSVLLAVQLAIKGQIPTLRTLVFLHRKTLHTELVLRILLSYLPESLESSEYVPFLEELESGSIREDLGASLDTTSVREISDSDAKKKARKLSLLQLLWPDAPEDVPAEPLVLFLIHRSIRIDQNTGLLTQLPQLLAPFLHLSIYLRIWTISTVLPLLRLNYEYHPNEATVLSILEFETLDDHAGVSLLLGNTGRVQIRDSTSDPTVGRDLRGLIGPFMYGDTRIKRRKMLQNSSLSLQTVEPHEDIASDIKYLGWEEVFKWIVNQAGISWKTVVEVVEQWDGPGDVDLGGYEDGTVWLDEDDQQHLETRYARSVLATAYLISEESEAALDGVQRILMRIITLLDQDRIPTLQAACALLSPVSDIIDESGLLSPKNLSSLRNDLLDEQNPLTSPKDGSIKLLHALLISASLCTRAKFPISIRRAGELALLQDEHEQKHAFQSLIHQIAKGPKEDDKYWIRARNEILWLWSWGAEELSAASNTLRGRGIFGQLSKEFIEEEVFKTFLTNTRYTLARSIYETTIDQPLPKQVLHDAIVSTIMNTYDNATNANKTRGGLKKCEEILHSFHENLDGSQSHEEITYLIRLTHNVGKYRLVFKQGEPFRPVNLRVHSDPISIIGKILDQNPRSYTKMRDMLDMGNDMVMAGLTRMKSVTGNMPRKQQKAIAEKRVVSMCIDAALAEDDFETAYSYVMTTPRATLQEILNVYRRCEEKLEILTKKEAAEEAKWDADGERQNMPGGFAEPPIKQNVTASNSRAAEEAPMSLFDLSRASVSRAQSGLSALSMLRGSNNTTHEATRPGSRTSGDISRASTQDSSGTRGPMRKRDQLKNVAVGGLASGVGWLLGAPPVNRNGDEDVH
ncbi:secretory pathway protein Sec39 [Diplocarpon rosae]|nr:secretory pathway protein Sec39 [Diplocarpon rosae]